MQIQFSNSEDNFRYTLDNFRYTFAFSRHDAPESCMSQSPSAMHALVLRAQSASTASRPYVRDDRETPLCLGRDGRIRKSDLPDGERGILPVGLTCRT
jgi:hypothetical protein